jgi:hypothetical protein
MKKFTLLWLIIICTTIYGYAQNDLGKSDDISRISLTPVVPEQPDGMPGIAQETLENKLQQIATSNGLGGINYRSRFFITVRVNLGSKDILPGPPPMHVYNMDITLFIADDVSKTVFSMATIQAKGVGTNENKAYISGINTININSPQLKTFIEQGKKKITEYYNAKCDFIIKEALTLAKTDRYEEAIYNLMSIPDVSKNCYDQALDFVPSVYQGYLDYLCNVNLAKAKAYWVANPNSAGANFVAANLASIYPDAACYGEAQKLVSEIQKKILHDENRDWDFMLHVWDDKVSIESQRINAWRDVGVAYGNNQPQYNYDINWVFPHH